MNRRFAMKALCGRVDKWVLLVGLAFVFLGGITGIAYGHAHLGSSMPAEGSTVTQWPETVRLQFTELMCL